MDFIGTYSPLVIYEDGSEKHNLYLGTENDLYYPTRNGYTIKACRAYFQLKNGLTAGNPSTCVRSLVMNFGEDEQTTAIREEVTVNSEEFSPAAGWYTLDGRRIGNGQKQKAKGLYIHNGKKVAVK